MTHSRGALPRRHATVGVLRGPPWAANKFGSPHEAPPRRAKCGAEGIRTLDPRLAKPMLSQLSYSPLHDIATSEVTWLDKKLAHQATPNSTGNAYLNKLGGPGWT